MIISHDRFGRKVPSRLCEDTNVFTSQSTRGLESPPKCPNCRNSGYGTYMVWGKKGRKWICPSCGNAIADYYNHFKMEKKQGIK